MLLYLLGGVSRMSALIKMPIYFPPCLLVSDYGAVSVLPLGTIHFWAIGSLQFAMCILLRPAVSMLNAYS